MKQSTYTQPVFSPETAWERYCGFTEKPLAYFMNLQEELLMRQIEYIHSCGLWKKIAGNVRPCSPEEFRDAVPLTTYEDYRETFSEKREDLLPAKVKIWAQTTGSSGDVKWIPYTEEFYQKFGDIFITAGFLSSGRKGRIPVERGDVLFYTIAPPPYGSGLGVQSALEKMDLVVLPPFEQAKRMTFAERIVTGFQMALEKGQIDIIGGIASVLVNIGRIFETRIGDYLTSDGSTFAAKENMLRKYLKAKSQGRSLVPKDFFSPKVILSAGADVSLFADAIERYWGKRPSECYGLTEAPLFAVQTPGCDDMVLVPNVAYLEFIPEERYNDKQPRTRLVNELEVGHRYETVVTNFFGGCVFRYRTGDLIEVASLKDTVNGIDIPTIRFYARADNVIHFSGVVRLNERVCWRIMEESGIDYNDWTVTKELRDERTYIHFYVETFEPKRRVLRKMRKSTDRTVATFGEIPELIGYNPLEVTILPEGAFSQYRSEMEAEGVDLGQIKPMHINPKPPQLERLKRISRQLEGTE